MTNDLTRRLEALERRLNVKHHSPLMVVIVEGALPPGEPLWAAAGLHEWMREPGEDLEAFAERAAQAARELKETAAGRWRPSGDSSAARSG